ncbi:MAG: ATP-binding cassette domain-containing protein, partial [Rhodococcus sp.]|nr:ATP-binding cassette domain-containing protein [Rhodococcus sp. (in: high G+C Gram-positive bacteria)]
MPTSVPDHSLVVEGLSAGYGSLTVVRDISFSVAAGEFVCLLGPNGAGKSTLLRALVGSATIGGGSVTFGGAELSGKRPHQITRRSIALVPEGRALVPDLSVRDNLLLGTVPWNRRYASADAS